MKMEKFLEILLKVEVCLDKSVENFMNKLEELSMKVKVEPNQNSCKEQWNQYKYDYITAKSAEQQEVAAAWLRKNEFSCM
jgi:hypothetical protein